MGVPKASNLEPPSRREARLRRLGRMAGLRQESLAVFLGPDVHDAALWSRLFGCKTIVVDSDAAALQRLERDAEALGIGNLLSLHEMDPLAPELPDDDAGANLVVAQGLATALGFDAAAEALRPRLGADGIVALFARTWVVPAVSDEVRSLWEARAKGPIRTVRETLERLSQIGYEPMACELVPASAWDEYYVKQDGFLAAMASGAGPETEAGRALASLREESRVHEAGGRTSASAGWFVGRRVEPDSPPRWPRRGFGE